MLAALTVSSWTLNPAPSSIELWPTWYWWINPTITANTNIGVMTLPVLAASWSSSNPAVALMETASGRIKALTPGAVTLTGILGGQQNSLAVNVVAPVLSPVEETVDPFLATPASGHLYKIPMAIIQYLPTRDGINIDSTISGWTGTVATLRSNLARYHKQLKFQLEERSKFRGYNNAGALPAVGYQVVKEITVFEDMPPGIPPPDNSQIYFPDYTQILTRFNAEEWVNQLGVKEIFVVGYHNGRIVPVESNMASPTTGDISNSFRHNDLPIYTQTYVVYGGNFARSDINLHIYGHQLEAILSHVNQLRDGNTSLFWQNFVGNNAAGQFQQGRCGNTHYPPNGISDYDYHNTTTVLSDIQDWTPANTGVKTPVNVFTWRNLPYVWPNSLPPDDIDQAHWLLYWMQNMPGRGNTIPYNINKMTNWWHFTGDWDAAITAGIGLYEPGSCNYLLSAISQSVSDTGGTISVNVTSSNGCKWIASSNEPWITITNGRTGNGNGTVSLNVAANNTGNARSGTVAVAGQPFTITQAATCPVITVSPATISPGATGGTYNQTFSLVQDKSQ